MDEAVEVLITSGDIKVIEEYFSKNDDKLEGMINLGADQDVCTTNGLKQNSLHLAVLNNHRNIAEYLITNGIKVNRKSSKGLTALHIASREGFDDIVSLLLKNDADRDCLTDDGLTALQFAAFNGHIEIVKRLLDINELKEKPDLAEVLEAHVNRLNDQQLDSLSSSKQKLKAAVQNDNDKTISDHIIEKSEKEYNIEKESEENNNGEKAKSISNESDTSKSGSKDSVDNKAELESEHNQNDSEAIKSDKESNKQVSENESNNCEHSKHEGEGSIKEEKHLNEAKGSTSDAEPKATTNSSNAVPKVDKKSGIKFTTPLIERSHPQSERSTLDESGGVSPGTYSTSDDLYSVDSTDDQTKGKKYGAYTRLFTCATCGEAERVKHLVKNHPELLDIHEFSSGNTVLHVAVDEGHFSIVKILVDAGIDVNSANTHTGLTPLHYALMRKDTKIYEYLLQKGADQNKNDKSGESPTILKERLQNEALLEFNKCWIMLCLNSQTEAVRYITRHGDVLEQKSFGGWSLLHWSALINGSKILSFLIENNCDISEPTSTGLLPIHIASMNNCFEAVKILVESGANIHAFSGDGLTAIHYAILNRCEDTLKQLKEYGLTVDDPMENQPNLLHKAAEEKDFDTVKYLLTLGSNINSKNLDGNTLLHLAVDLENEELIDFLLSKGSDINAVNDKHESPIFIPIQKNNIKLTEKLANLGADLNVQNEDGNAAFHIVIQKKAMDIAKILIEMPFDINLQNNDGDTPLHIAGSMGLLWFCNLLLDHGANPMIVNKKDLTPAQLATSKGFKKTGEKLALAAMKPE